MKLSVWKLGNWIPSKFNDGKNMQIQFKGIDDNNRGKTYKLNLGSMQKEKEAWLRVCVEGTVVDDIWVLVGTNTINKFHVPRISTNVTNGAAAVDEEGQLPGQIELFNE